MTRSGAPPPTSRRQILPRSVVALGVVSLLMDMSSEMIHALLPVFLVSVIGASPLVLGLIEGMAEALALFARVYAGVISDRLRRRKPLVVAGYLLAALAKPAFALATTAGLVAIARAGDRLGKGIRGAPRDALIADIAPAERRGAAFGLRQAMDTAGAIAGPAIALLLTTLFALSVSNVFWIATIPAALCVLVLVTTVKEVPVERTAPSSLSAAGSLGDGFWLVCLLGAVFQLARFSEAFLVLRAADIGWAIATVPIVLIVLNIAYSAVAYPAGHISDRTGRIPLLATSMVVLVAADLVLAASNESIALISGTVLWGIHMGLSSGVLAALVTDSVSANQRGTAFGFFNLLSGISLLGASVAAGALWHWFSPELTFLVSAALALGALVLLLLLRPRLANRAIGIGR